MYPKLLDTTKSIQKYPKVVKSIEMYPKVTKCIRKYPKVFSSIQMYSKLSESIQTYQIVSKSVEMYFSVPYSNKVYGKAISITLTVFLSANEEMFPARGRSILFSSPFKPMYLTHANILRVMVVDENRIMKAIVDRII